LEIFDVGVIYYFTGGLGQDLRHHEVSDFQMKLILAVVFVNEDVFEFDVAMDD